MNTEPLRRLIRDPRAVIPVGVGLIVIAAAAAYLIAARPAAPPDRAEPVSEAMPEPSAQNVDPVVHARLMTLRRDVEAAPRDTALLFELARMEYDAHQLEPAVATFERLLAVAPDHRQAYLDLAQALVTLGRPEDASGAMERLLDRYPGDLAALYNLGAIAANQGDNDGARRHWTQVAAANDAEMARRASESLAELERMAAPGPVTPATSVPGSGGGLPPGHPPIPGGFETSVITGPPLPEGAPQPAAPAR